jgi:uncharacterized protein YdhG (YjbR/CyaY superfamily)
MEDKFQTVDDYINAFPVNIQERLNQIRQTIKANAPDATEAMAYGMPAYKTEGKPLVYFAAFKKHIGLYATPTGHEKFANELAPYKQGKGSVQFPLNKPLPLELIAEMVKFRVAENIKKIK